jgi:bifunctional DNase/RNase
MMRVTLADVLQESEQQYVLMLLHADKEHISGIWTGFQEGLQIAWLASDLPWVWGGRRRPLTLDLAARLLLDAGVFVDSIQIASIEQEIFHAEVLVRGEQEDLRVDARPSDAIALAIALKRPVYIDPQVMAATTWPVAEVYSRGNPIGFSLEQFTDAFEKLWEPYGAGAVANHLHQPEAQHGIPVPNTGAETLEMVDLLPATAATSTIVLQSQASGWLLPFEAISWEAVFLAWLATRQPWPENQPQRPMTYPFLAALFETAGVQFESLELHSVQEGVVHARITVAARGRTHTVDARPIDALGLSLASGHPLTAAAGIATSGTVPESLYADAALIGQDMRTLTSDLGKAWASEEAESGEKQGLVGRVRSFFQRKEAE